ncbi:hypothetical protein [Xanthocytophaga agilis]|uniref:Uncharacterized protein n=1 Tax=Xanthocytophaga agilis TaxID=3048010 RepID=A0AAE3R853_9BACT|nr:hypothetical protein [Xanthocytophaga agilis]MDJ1503337.1 hypothetical protein [Xanthocytophaga agilis]
MLFEKDFQGQEWYEPFKDTSLKNMTWAKCLLKREFYCFLDYKSFYDTESYVSVFHEFSTFCKPDLDFQVLSYDGPFIYLLIDGEELIYEKEDTHYSDDQLCDKLNLFLCERTTCSLRFSQFHVSDWTCIGLMSKEQYDVMKQLQLVPLVEGEIDSQEMFW